MTAPASSYTLLVVDSCQDSQARIQEQLQGKGFSIISSADPTDALAMIDLTVPDVVITDLFLPEGKGLDLTKAMRTRHEPCPVIVMAEQTSESLLVQALRAGAIDYIHKPIEVEELAYALQRARCMVLSDLTEDPGFDRAEYRLTTRSNPANIPGIVAWLIKTTAFTLPEIKRLQLRGALQELLFNAMEHGNLEIFYHEKQRALCEEQYDELIAERLAQPRLSHRTVTIHVLYAKDEKSIQYRIADEGKGFKWRGILHRSHEACRSEDANGRGIFLARSFFPDLTYNDAGNEVTIRVQLD